jgi:hypothetical protein
MPSGRIVQAERGRCAPTRGRAAAPFRPPLLARPQYRTEGTPKSITPYPPWI